MRRLASAVSLITFAGPEGHDGIVVSSLTSISAAPPTVMFALNRQARTHAALASAERFHVNILAEGQDAIASRFTGPGSPQDRFASCAWGSDGLVLEDAAACLICNRTETVDIATHALIFGEVAEIRMGSATLPAPLLYHDGRYRRLMSAEEALA